MLLYFQNVNTFSNERKYEMPQDTYKTKMESKKIDSCQKFLLDSNLNCHGVAINLDR